MVNVPQGWSGDDKRLTRNYRFGSFAEALAFMVEVGLYCERADHHPEWKNIYSRVWVELSTHDAGRVTDKDLALAAHMDKVFARGR